MTREITPTLSKALGLPAGKPDWARLREALGLHQRPQALFDAMARHPDDMPPPVMPAWDQEVHSPHHRAWLALPPQEQEKAAWLRDGLSYEKVHETWLERLHQMQARHPQVVQLFNFEAAWLRRQGEIEASREMTESILRRFPGEIFAACALAGYYLAKGDTETIRVIFNGSAELRSTLDRRYHASEVAAFYGIMAWTHLLDRRLLRAACCICLVHAARPRDPFLDNLSAWLLELGDETLIYLKGQIQGQI